MDYIWNDNEFRSVKKVKVMGEMMTNIVFKPDENKLYYTIANENEKNESFEKDLAEPDDKGKDDSGIRLVRYKAKVDFLSDGQYGYITLKENNEFHIETNFSSVNAKIIPAIIADGNYVIEECQESLAPDAPVVSFKMIRFYVDGKKIDEFFVGDKQFNNQWYSYEYIEE